MEFDFQIYGADKKVVSVDLNIPLEESPGPWLPRWVKHANRAVKDRGGSLNAAHMLQHWVGDHEAFVDVNYRQWFAPTGPFMTGDDPETVEARATATLMREDVKVSFFI